MGTGSLSTIMTASMGVGTSARAQTINNGPIATCSCLVGLNSFDLLSLCRPRQSRHIPSLAPWAPMSGYTLYVFRRAVVT
ncbi:hypothetical protein TNCV_505661 [Trichonephila clavipes]|nr:hypothetical protein TNCV_505661 [Trichonephila clavipes]